MFLVDNDILRKHKDKMRRLPAIAKRNKATEHIKCT